MEIKIRLANYRVIFLSFLVIVGGSVFGWLLYDEMITRSKLTDKLLKELTGTVGAIVGIYIFMNLF